LAGMRCAHLNCKNKETEGSVDIKGFREGQQHDEERRSAKTHREDGDLPISQSPVGKHQKQPRRRPRVRCLPDHLRHAALDLKRQREDRSGHGPRPGGPIGCHLAKAKQPPPEQHDSSGVVLPHDGGQGDPGSSETPQHRPMIPEDLFLLRLRGVVGPIPPRLADRVPCKRG
jgi:hypothetical protein